MRGIGVAEAEVLDVLAELPLQRPRLHSPNRLGWSKPMKPPSAGALSDRRTEVDVAGPLFLDVEDQVDVALVVRLPRVRRRHVLLEEAKVGDAAIALNQAVLVEHVARQDVRADRECTSRS